MHEVSIALAMVDELARIAGENKSLKVLNVTLKIGRLSGIVVDSLRFAFDAVKLENPLLSSAEVTIEEIPLVYECCDCHTSFSSDDMYFPSCPDCESVALKIVSGEEQHIANVELEI